MTSAQKLMPKTDIESDRFQIRGFAVVHCDVAFGKNTLIGLYSREVYAQEAIKALDIQRQAVVQPMTFWSDHKQFKQ